MHVVRIVLLSLFCLPLCVQAASSVSTSRKKNQVVMTDQVVTSQKVRIQVKERALKEVLEQIHQTSGVDFLLPKPMRNIPITATINAADWPMAIRQLLRSFNTAEVWEGNGKNLLRVTILGQGQAEMIGSERVGAVNDEYPKRDETKPPDAPPTKPPPVPGPPPNLIPCGEGCIQWR
jgi:hypothetical protein